jgi:hypothetical protein
MLAAPKAGALRPGCAFSSQPKSLGRLRSTGEEHGSRGTAASNGSCRRGFSSWSHHRARRHVVVRNLGGRHGATNLDEFALGIRRSGVKKACARASRPCRQVGGRRAPDDPKRAFSLRQRSLCRAVVEINRRDGSRGTSGLRLVRRDSKLESRRAMSSWRFLDPGEGRNATNSGGSSRPNQAIWREEGRASRPADGSEVWSTRRPGTAASVHDRSGLVALGRARRGEPQPRHGRIRPAVLSVIRSPEPAWHRLITYETRTRFSSRSCRPRRVPPRALT